MKKIYALKFSPEPDLSYEFFISLDEGGLPPHFASDVDYCQLFIDSLKECVLLKKGAAVYTKHLAAYFSRLLGYHNPKYPQFSKFFFNDIIQRLQEKNHKLSALHSSKAGSRIRSEGPFCALLLRCQRDSSHRRSDHFTGTSGMGRLAGSSTGPSSGMPKAPAVC
jgi:hypothetical protein